MTDYRRAKFEGGFYFFTVVTYNRRPFLTHDLARDCLRQVWRETKQKREFEVIALCLLPEHLHCVWKLPEEDCDYSGRWAAIKSGFSRRYLSSGGIEGSQSDSRIKKRERGIWQRRFWEHQIRDEKDLQRHVDYTHYNPVKHGLVKELEDWPWSTYHKYVQKGFYAHNDWDKIQEDFYDGFAGE
ncbi:MAG: transposase [Sedimentisphaerales bacterium]|nr:transposase [Sedimentisphaerales bacterium]